MCILLDRFVSTRELVTSHTRLSCGTCNNARCGRWRCGSGARCEDGIDDDCSSTERTCSRPIRRISIPSVARWRGPRDGSRRDGGKAVWSVSSVTRQHGQRIRDQGRGGGKRRLGNPARRFPVWGCLFGLGDGGASGWPETLPPAPPRESIKVFMTDGERRREYM